MNPSPENDLSPEREPTPVEQIALAWVVRAERGLSPEQEGAFAEWLSADPHHREIFEEFGGTWAFMTRLAAESAAATGDPAAVTGLTIPPGRATAVDRAAGPARRGPRTVWLALAAAAAIALAWVGGWRPAQEGTAIATDVGASRRLTLIDGSTIELNTDSSVVATFTSGERRVRLEKGEAYFKVAKDAARPFVVEAAGVGVRALGTAFNVRVHPESVEVLVTEGKVAVAPAREPKPGAMAAPPAAEVGAGERVVVSVAARTTAPAAPEVARVPTDEMQRRLAWQDRRLVFSDTTLGEMVAEFNRYNVRKLVVPDPGLAAMRFGGSFRADDRAGFVRMLRENFGIMAEESGERTHLRAAR